MSFRTVPIKRELKCIIHHAIAKSYLSIAKTIGLF